ncbi:MAG: metallopeptidase family protein [Candidatus Saccharibacteria bacterium]|nr:metallopeptidase family protein [Candidatus Saccharibacteria bacterium]
MQHPGVDIRGIQKNRKDTVWHEVAHYFGLDHDRIYRLEGKDRKH